MLYIPCRENLTTLLPRLKEQSFLDSISLHLPSKPSVTDFNVGKQENQKIARLAHAKRTKHMDEIRQQLKTVAGRGGGGLENLKLFAMQRATESLAKKDAEVKLVHDALLRNRMTSLPALCSVLRSMALSERRTANRTSKEVISKLAPDLGISEDELRQRLGLLVAYVPEFLSVLPPDDTVTVETIQINLSAPFKQIRDKLFDRTKI